ncbi:MAG: hypothetical protein AAF772_04230 [Acidobacteriota bacterium]
MSTPFFIRGLPRRFGPLALVLCLATFLALPAAHADDHGETVRTLKQTFFAGDVETLELDLTFGDIVVEGSLRRSVRVEVVVTCNDELTESECRRYADRLALRARTKRDRLDLGLRGTPRARIQGLRAEMRIQMPRRLGLEIDQRAGSATVRDVAGDIEIDGGSLDVEVSRTQSKTSMVAIDLAVGDGVLHTADGAKQDLSGFPRSLRWRGDGESKIEIDLAGGQVTVRLT